MTVYHRFVDRVVSVSAQQAVDFFVPSTWIRIVEVQIEAGNTICFVARLVVAGERRLYVFLKYFLSPHADRQGGDISVKPDTHYPLHTTRQNSPSRRTAGRDG